MKKVLIVAAVAGAVYVLYWANWAAPAYRRMS